MPTLAMRGITKSFGANYVLRGVDLRLQGGEVLALLGENGAGKSTLMNILGGVYSKDGGEITIDGKPAAFATPAESIKSGVAFIHQELNLINDLSIYENLYLGAEETHGIILRRESMIDGAKAVFQGLGIDVDVRMKVARLDASYKQITEIAKATRLNPSFIIMDEPTTSLTGVEIERVFALMRTLKANGVGIIFISHKLPEVMEICDKYIVLRDGEVAANGDVRGTNEAALASAMVGRSVRSGRLDMSARHGEPVIAVQNLSGKSFRNVNFTIAKGEILGFTGLLGDGRSELFLSLFGDGEPYTGSVDYEGERVRIKSPTDAARIGVAYIPRNRKENGILKDMSVLENGTITIMPRRSRYGLLRRKVMRDEFHEQSRQLRVKCENIYDGIVRLSGGNQQKMILARWLLTKPRLLILDNPTQGVDVGAKEEIYDIILGLARGGAAIAFLSGEAQEIVRVCTRAIVMYHGEVAGEVEGESMNEGKIMRLATGIGD